MIRSSICDSGGCFSDYRQIRIPNIPSGSYSVFVYIWEDNNSEIFSVYVEGQLKQSGVPSGKAGDWKRLGPYTSSVNDGTLDVSFRGGNVNVSGIEIWK